MPQEDKQINQMQAKDLIYKNIYKIQSDEFIGKVICDCINKDIDILALFNGNIFEGIVKISNLIKPVVDLLINGKKSQIKEFISHNIPVINKNTLILDILKVMLSSQSSYVVVIEEGNFLGIIGTENLLVFFTQHLIKKI